MRELGARRWYRKLKSVDAESVTMVSDVILKATPALLLTDREYDSWRSWKYEYQKATRHKVVQSTSVYYYGKAVPSLIRL